ncbi:uncharacterized protein ACMZJ9_022697 [Mantella aurantiaca]
MEVASRRCASQEAAGGQPERIVDTCGRLCSLCEIRLAQRQQANVHSNQPEVLRLLQETLDQMRADRQQQHHDVMQLISELKNQYAAIKDLTAAILDQNAVWNELLISCMTSNDRILDIEAMFLQNTRRE